MRLDCSGWCELLWHLFVSLSTVGAEGHLAGLSGYYIELLQEKMDAERDHVSCPGH